MNVSSIKNLIQKYIDTGLARNKLNENYPVLYLQGIPGIGKSEIIKQICIQNKWNLKSIYMSTMLIEQLTGLPIPDQKNGVTWTLPEIFDFSSSKMVCYYNSDRPIILLFDDAHLINKQMQSYLFQLPIYRAINSFKLPENCVIIMAGNKITDKAGANPILSPVVNRIVFVEMENNIHDWINNYAIPNRLHPAVISYMEQLNKINFFIGQPMENYPWPSPRSWSYVSQMLYMYEDESLSDICDIISGLIGYDPAKEFIEYYAIFPKILYSDILNNGLSLNNKSVLQIYATIILVARTISNKIEDDSFDEKDKHIFDELSDFLITNDRYKFLVGIFFNELLISKLKIDQFKKNLFKCIDIMKYKDIIGELLQ